MPAHVWGSNLNQRVFLNLRFHKTLRKNTKWKTLSKLGNLPLPGTWHNTRRLNRRANRTGLVWWVSNITKTSLKILSTKHRDWQSQTKYLPNYQNWSTGVKTARITCSLSWLWFSMIPINFRLSAIKPCFYWKYKEDFKRTFKIWIKQVVKQLTDRRWQYMQVEDRQRNKQHKIVSGLVKDFGKNFI